MLSATARQYYLFGTRAIWYPYCNYCVYSQYPTDNTDTDTAVILIRDILCEHRGCIIAIHAYACCRSYAVYSYYLCAMPKEPSVQFSYSVCRRHPTVVFVSSLSTDRSLLAWNFRLRDDGVEPCGIIWNVIWSACSVLKSQLSAWAGADSHIG